MKGYAATAADGTAGAAGRAPISVVIPTAGAGPPLAETLAALVPGVSAGLVRELVLAGDDTTPDVEALADAIGARFVRASDGRARHAGAGAASAPWLLFLQPRVRLGDGWIDAVRLHMRARPERGGWFRLRYDRGGPALRLGAVKANLLARGFGRLSADHGLLLPRVLYEEAVGRPASFSKPDVALVPRLGRGRLAPLAAEVLVEAPRRRGRSPLRVDRTGSRDEIPRPEDRTTA